MQISHGVPKKTVLLDIIDEHLLTEVVNIPTRNDKLLTCFLLTPHPL